MSDLNVSELHERLPEGRWVDLPEYGVRVLKPPPPELAEPEESTDA